MGSSHRHTILGQYIANILGTGQLQTNSTRTGTTGRAAKSLAYGSMALLAIAPAHVGAVGLGEIELRSQLGQPLNATVPLILSDGETLPANCVQPAPPGGNTLGTPPKLNITSPRATGPGTYSIRVSTANALHEPMYELSLMVKCPGTSLLVRQYVLMLDLPGMPVPPQSTTAAPAVSTGAQAPVTSPVRMSTPQRSTPRAATPATPPATHAPVTAAQRSTPVVADPARALQRSTTPIPAGSQYRVVKGDTLSTIAQRVEGRLPNTIWPVANRIFADNPRAFVRNNPDMIKLGMLIRVPTTSELTALEPNVQRVTTAAPAPEAPQLPDSQPRSLPVRQSEPATATHVVVPTESRELPADIRATPDNVTEMASPRSEPSPFADESFAPRANVSVSDATPATRDTTPEPTTGVDTDTGTDSSTSPLMTLLFALLLSGAVALLLLRRRLFEALGRHRRKTGKSLAGASHDATAVGARTRTFETTTAQPAPVEIGDPAEETYIVETEVGEATVREQTLDIDLAGMTNPDITGHNEPPDAGDDTVLAKLFDDDYSTASADASAYTPELQPSMTGALDPTQELPQQVSDDEIFDPSGGLSAHADSEIFDPTAEMPRDAGPAQDPTAKMPNPAGGVIDPTGAPSSSADEESFDPTHAVSVDELNASLEPTTELEGMPAGDPESTLMQAFTDDLAGIDADEMFATASHSLNAPATGEIADAISATAADDALEELRNNRDEDGDLSDTLHEALMLLERDFEDDFTASQIIEQKQLKEALEDNSEQEDETQKTRKIS